MTEEIIIDGVDVAGCRELQKDCQGEYVCLDRNRKSLYCNNQEYCYYKQLKRLEQKYHEVLKLAKTNADSNEYCLQELEQKYEQLRSALEEIREKIKSLNKDICNNCGWHNTDNCQPNGYVCHDLIEIKNKINEVLND